MSLPAVNRVNHDSFWEELFKPARPLFSHTATVLKKNGPAPGSNIPSNQPDTLRRNVPVGDPTKSPLLDSQEGEPDPPLHEEVRNSGLFSPITTKIRTLSTWLIDVLTQGGSVARKRAAIVDQHTKHLLEHISKTGTEFDLNEINQTINDLWKSAAPYINTEYRLSAIINTRFRAYLPNMSDKQKLALLERLKTLVEQIENPQDKNLLPAGSAFLKDVFDIMRINTALTLFKETNHAQINGAGPQSTDQRLAKALIRKMAVHDALGACHPLENNNITPAHIQAKKLLKKYPDVSEWLDPLRYKRLQSLLKVTADDIDIPAKWHADFHAKINATLEAYPKKIDDAYTSLDADFKALRDMDSRSRDYSTQRSQTLQSLLRLQELAVKSDLGSDPNARLLLTKAPTVYLDKITEVENALVTDIAQQLARPLRITQLNDFVRLFHALNAHLPSANRTGINNTADAFCRKVFLKIVSEMDNNELSGLAKVLNSSDADLLQKTLAKIALQLSPGGAYKYLKLPQQRDAHHARHIDLGLLRDAVQTTLDRYKHATPKKTRRSLSAAGILDIIHRGMGTAFKKQNNASSLTNYQLMQQSTHAPRTQPPPPAPTNHKTIKLLINGDVSFPLNYDLKNVLKAEIRKLEIQNPKYSAKQIAKLVDKKLFSLLQESLKQKRKENSIEISEGVSGYPADYSEIRYISDIQTIEGKSTLRGRLILRPETLLLDDSRRNQPLSIRPLDPEQSLERIEWKFALTDAYTTIDGVTTRKIRVIDHTAKRVNSTFKFAEPHPI